MPATPQTILSITGGDVYVMRAGTSNWVLAEAGTTLQPGDYVRCANDAHAEVTFFEGSTIELNGETQVSLSDIGLSDTGSTTIHLKQYFGNTVSRVKKLTDSASTYEVETQAAVAAVRGSTMSLTVLADGTTIVTNIEGDIRVIAQGVEVIIPEGMKCTIIPGQALGQPEPIVPPTTTEPVYITIVNTGVSPDRLEAIVGETITYSYFISNSGNLAVSDIRVSDDVTGAPVLLSGDSNGNSSLDPGETWTYTASHIVSADDPSPLVNTATFSGMFWTNSTMFTTHDQAQVNTPGLFVEISNPLNGAIVTDRTINISGTVSDTVVSGNITINNISHGIEIAEGGFNTSENLNSGENEITVTVTDGVYTACDTITINVDAPPYGIWVQLTWNKNGNDLDSHLIRPSGMLGEVSDCYFDNENPDWGNSENSTDDPSLDQDNTWGLGPENITLQEPYETGFYQYKVHYYPTTDLGPTTANVTIWINDVIVAQYSKSLVFDEIWDCALIEWPSGNVIGSWPAIAVTKTALPLEVYVGDNVTYTYHVTNVGNALLDNVSVNDDIAGEAAYLSGDTDDDGTLDLTETWVFTVDYTVTSDDIGTLTNTATASGMFWHTEETVTDEASASVTVNPSETPPPSPTPS